MYANVEVEGAFFQNLYPPMRHLPLPSSLGEHLFLHMSAR